MASDESRARRAPYDQIAEWYETEFLVAQRSAASDGEFADRIGIDQALVELLGVGQGLCLEVGCGTGIYSARVRELGWTPLGIDLSAGMLRFATDRMPVALADATSLPCPDAMFDAVLTVMVHTDVPAYAPALSEIDRVRSQAASSFTSACIHASAVGSPIVQIPTRLWCVPDISTGPGRRTRGPTKDCATRLALLTCPSRSC